MHFQEGGSIQSMYFNVENLKNMILVTRRKEYFFFAGPIWKNLDDSRNYKSSSHSSASKALYASKKYQRSYRNRQ
jgi:hypothetical protein